MPFGSLWTLDGCLYEVNKPSLLSFDWNYDNVVYYREVYTTNRMYGRLIATSIGSFIEKFKPYISDEV